MNPSKFYRWVPLLAAVVLSACSTPQAALDQANNGAALTASLESELREFRRVQAEIAKARIESMRRQNTRLATYEVDAAFEGRVQEVAGKTGQSQLYAKLKELADSRVKDEKDIQAKLAKADESFAKLLSPLPESSGKLTATQQALMTLGEQLSYKERIELTASFVKTIKKSVEDNKKKINDAEAATPTATAQPAAVIK